MALIALESSAPTHSDAHEHLLRSVRHPSKSIRTRHHSKEFGQLNCLGKVCVSFCRESDNKRGLRD